MKKALFIVSFLFFIFSYSAKAQTSTNPIPSYDVPVTGEAAFTEPNIKADPTPAPVYEKRDLNVESTSPSTLSPFSMEPATVWFVRLDGHRMKGPYQLYPGNILTVKIDMKPWGVYVQSPETGIFSVYGGSTAGGK